jgi:hypothetical protein
LPRCFATALRHGSGQTIRGCYRRFQIDSFTTSSASARSTAGVSCSP